uniref:Uncharacterized protein n=1 Tax=Ciona savignyi TaxID=51511 RepID=H2ZKJ2_CIOSA
MNRNVGIVLSTSQDDWDVVRECYVQSFLRYPLYKYMVPDDKKRADFLRAYLDANYEVTVASGNGILLAVKYTTMEINNNECEKSMIIGGVVFVPPSDDGHGWAITDDEPYWEAYEKYGLAKISPDGLEIFTQIRSVGKRKHLQEIIRKSNPDVERTFLRDLSRVFIQGTWKHCL